MSKSSVGQGRQVQVDVKVDGEPVTSIVFGSKSGHPFFRDGISWGTNLHTELVGVFADCLLHMATIHNEENFLSLLEFVDHMSEEAMKDAGDFSFETTHDQKEGGEFPF